MMSTAEVQFVLQQWAQIRAGLFFEYILGLKAF